MLTWIPAHPGRYLRSGGNHAESSTKRVFPGGVTRRCLKAGEQVRAPGLGRSLPEKATSATCPRRSDNTGTPFVYGPYQVERTFTATVFAPAAVTATSLGHPVKRHGM